MLSDENRKILEYIAEIESRCMPVNERPLWMDPWRLESLAEQKLLMPMTIVPPGVEGYVHGLFGWKLTPEGEDSIEQHYDEIADRAEQLAEKEAEQQRMMMDRKADKRHDYVIFFLGLILGWLLGSVTPVDVWDWFLEAVEKMMEFLH